MYAMFNTIQYILGPFLYQLNLISVVFSILQNFGGQLDSTEDDINLVESQANDKDAHNKVSTKLWRTFANIIDRILFVALSLTYIIMVLSLLPENYLDEKDVTSVEIVGY